MFITWYCDLIFSCEAVVYAGKREAPLKEPEPSEPEESKPRIRRGLYNMSVHQVGFHIQ